MAEDAINTKATAAQDAAPHEAPQKEDLLSDELGDSPKDKEVHSTIPSATGDNKQSGDLQ